MPRAQSLNNMIARAVHAHALENRNRAAPARPRVRHYARQSAHAPAAACVTMYLPARADPHARTKLTAPTPGAVLEASAGVRRFDCWDDSAPALAAGLLPRTCPQCPHKLPGSRASGISPGPRSTHPPRSAQDQCSRMNLYMYVSFDCALGVHTLLYCQCSARS